MKTLICNGKVITPEGVVDGGAVLIEDGKIIRVGNFTAASDEKIDAEGAWVCPGFIDIHTHGAGGADYMDGTVDAYLTAARMQAVHGATTVLPTSATNSNEELFESFEMYRRAVLENRDGARFAGMHLEGPYFNPVQAGAQDPKYLRSPKDPADYLEIIRRGDGIIRRWSFAPELEGAPEFAATLKRHGILPSIGHTAASWEQCDESFRNGATHITHFYSCISSITRKGGFRTAGVMEYGLYQKGMSIELIADGCHVPKTLLQLVLEIKGVDKISLVTDSMRGAGMPEGPSIIGSLKENRHVIIEDGVAKVLDRSCFAGSVATADRCVRTMINVAGCSVGDAVRMMTVNPAKMIGIYGTKGSLEAGKDADIVIWDGDVEIRRTIIGGTTVYQK